MQQWLWPRQPSQGAVLRFGSELLWRYTVMVPVLHPMLGWVLRINRNSTHGKHSVDTNRCSACYQHIRTPLPMILKQKRSERQTFISACHQTHSVAKPNLTRVRPATMCFCHADVNIQKHSCVWPWGCPGSPGLPSTQCVLSDQLSDPRTCANPPPLCFPRRACGFCPGSGGSSPDFPSSGDFPSRVRTSEENL